MAYYRQGISLLLPWPKLPTTSGGQSDWQADVCAMKPLLSTFFPVSPTPRFAPFLQSIRLAHWSIERGSIRHFTGPPCCALQITLTRRDLRGSNTEEVEQCRILAPQASALVQMLRISDKIQVELRNPHVPPGSRSRSPVMRDLRSLSSPGSPCLHDLHSTYRQQDRPVGSRSSHRKRGPTSSLKVESFPGPLRRTWQSPTCSCTRYP